MVTDSFLNHIEQLRFEINERLQNFPLDSEPKYIYDPIKYIMDGRGKRLRPIIVNLVGTVYGANKDDILNAGLAVELLHNFTLVHDDIMDQDNLRHGKATVHKKWDESTAILAGDGIYAIAQILITKVQINPLKAVHAFNKATLYVCEGQAYDKEFENNHEITIDQYLTMIKKKTGWLIGFCAELGGILGNQPDSIINELQSYGMNLGIAFQIQDDILEIFSDSKSMGKSLGSDLIAGKQTILTVLARQNDALGWKQQWDGILNSDIQIALEKLRTYFENNGILKSAKNMAKKYTDAAQNNLQIIPEEKRIQLEQLTEFVWKRKK
ncbi:MAG: polyprenyl synthetase family protein [Candidatus Marinimicrobia bacterium]|nr:polyprenyl synthetase family protein [Candidatus Neomarinimicrobiota bacterium]